MSFYLNPKIGIDKGSGRMLISFVYPNNPVEFFVYSVDGKYQDQFQYEIEKQYTFPSHFLDFPVKYPPIAYVPFIRSILVYKSHFVVFLTKLKYRKEFGETVGCDCLIFDGKTKNPKVRLSVDKNLNPFFISDDGYLLASKSHDETERLYIYKLEF
jgi:hypothetical protein